MKHSNLRAESAEGSLIGLDDAFFSPFVFGWVGRRDEYRCSSVCGPSAALRRTGLLKPKEF